MQIAIVGECMIEHREGTSAGDLHFGGDTVNTAVYLSRLLSSENADVLYVSQLGGSEKDKRLLACFKDEGLNCSMLPLLPGRQTGSYTIHTDETGERHFTYDRAHSPARETLRSIACNATGQLASCDVLYVTGITLAIFSPEDRETLLALMAKMKEAGKQVVYDMNHRPVLWESTQIAREIHQRAADASNIFMPSIEDLEMVFGAEESLCVIEKQQGRDDLLLVLKNGGGELAISKAGRQYVYGLRVNENVVDTTGAGDSFNAGFLAAYLTNGSIDEAVEKAHQLASTVIMHRGAIIPQEAMPS
ncbi:sugar kinase [Kordiimonas sp. SCSIO 12603]|uniref:sugar kinase n=1 Tax=Kordiimonas sp. SCSIO 12603 TaxID=2829596 RepID=UPI0021078EC8|nr:sugar kinase [Kordiimonas sp. SCSIO 12603]UTW60202.1 sugar kinase [Kordiimonas sp. SCSIO 12603]